MLNTFPQLLYPFFAPLILRVGVALAFAGIAYLQWKRQDELSQITLPVIGKNNWWVWLSILVLIIDAAMLLFGWYTQIAAILGALLALKHAYWGSKYPRAFPYSRAANLLVCLICVSLLVSGAGALAQDLPL